jgi:hypothetical protein
MGPAFATLGARDAVNAGWGVGQKKGKCIFFPSPHHIFPHQTAPSLPTPLALNGMQASRSAR